MLRHEGRLPGRRAGLRAHRPARRRADPRPVPRRQRDRLAWIGRTDWRTRPSFDGAAPAHERIDLVCDGLDTVADVALNGVGSGRTANMHRSLPLRRAPALRPAATAAPCASTPPTPYAEAVRGAARRPARRLRRAVQLHPQDGLQLRLGLGPDAGHRRHLAAGRPASAWSTARLAAVRPLVTVDGGAGRVEVHVDVERARVDGAADASPRRSAGCRRGRRVPAGATRRSCALDRARRASCGGRAGTASSRCYDRRGDPAADEGGAAGRLAARGSASARVELDTAPDAHGTRVHAGRQRRAGLRPRRQLDPRRRVPVTGSTRERLPRAARARRSTPASTCCGSGAAGVYESDDFYDLATSSGCWSGRTSCSPAPPTRRRSRCAARSRPRRARTSPG